MHAAIFNGPHKLAVEEMEVPAIGPGELLLRVGANTLCGTDLRIFRGEKSRGVRQPSVLGHELAGVVAEVGPRTQGFEVGMPVAMAPVVPCRRCWYCTHDQENACAERRAMGYEFDGGLSEYVRIPALALSAGNLFPAQEDTPSEALALVEPLSCCVNGHRRSRIQVGSTVLIMGGGPIGLLHLQLARLAGARTVLVSEPSASRRKVAADLGAHLAIDPTDEDLAEAVTHATGGLGVDSTIICIGLAALVNDSIRLTRKGGTVNIFAGLAGRGWTEVEANEVHYKEQWITGTTAARRRDYADALRLVESRRIDVQRLVTHRFSLEDALEAFDVAASGEGLKVAVMP